MKVVLRSKFDGYKEEERVDQERKQAQPAQARRESEGHNG